MNRLLSGLSSALRAMIMFFKIDANWG